MTGPDLLALFGASNFSLKKNLDGIDETLALRTPPLGGNSVNWIAGHVLYTRQRILVTALSEPLLSLEELVMYEGKVDFEPEESRPLEQIKLELDDSMARLVEAIRTLTTEQLDEMLERPFLGQRVNRGQMLGLFEFHEAYHAGQIGMLRRVFGLAGKISVR